MQILWAVACCRFPDKSKYIFASWFVSILAFNNYTAFNRDPDSILFVQTQYNENFIQITVLYVATMAFFTYCEFLLCLFVYSPLYFISCITLTIAQADEINAVQDQVDPSHKYLIGSSTQQNITRAFLMAATLLLAKFAQRLDVCQLIMKNWVM